MNKDTILSEDYPSLYRVSDNNSVHEQKQFTRLMFINIGLMIFAAGAGALILSDNNTKVVLAIISAILLTISVIFTSFIRSTRLEQNWYYGRAISESVKTATWRYLTGCTPYSLKLGSRADERYLHDIESILKEFQQYASKLYIVADSYQVITEKMRLIRNLDTETRKNIYIRERIQNQREWYSKKACMNQKSASRYFYSIFVCQILAVSTSISMIFWHNSPIQFTGIFTTVATALMAWTQMRRNEELAQSYGLTAQELSFVLEQSFKVNTEEQLSSYVSNAEMTISREHTRWTVHRP
jgi:uncharacterized membrane protein